MLCFGLQLLNVFNWKQQIKSTGVDVDVKGLPSKKPLPGLGFPIPRKEIPKEAIKSAMSRRKNNGDNYLLFPQCKKRKTSLSGNDL